MMMKFIKNNWHTWAIFTIAGVIVYREFQALDWQPYWRIANVIENPFFRATGIWSIRFLLLSLLMSPLYAFSGWRFALKLRKPLGLVAFGFVSIHAYIHFTYKFASWEHFDLWKRITMPYYVIFGVIAFVILAMLAMTSVKPMMKFMGRLWKPLHRMVYGAGILIMMHVILAVTENGKRWSFGGQEALSEYQVYLGFLIVLLVVRIPIIKRVLQRAIPFAPNPRKSKPKATLVTS